MRFEKVSLNRWAKDIDIKGIDGLTLKRWHEEIILPKQGAEHSMGIDFFCPYQVSILPHNKIKIATGIRWVCDEDDDKNYGMIIAPRSGLGTKYGMRLLNTIGVIDSTYFESDNEGEIYLVFENPSDEVIDIPKGKAIAQGIIIPYFVPKSARSEVQRNGGLGSSDNTEGHV